MRELLLAEMLRNSTIFSQALGERNTAGLYIPLRPLDAQEAKGGTGLREPDGPEGRRGIFGREKKIKKDSTL